MANTSSVRLPRAALAGALLLLQALAGSAVTLVHASEPLTAASHIESQHEPGCPALHDVQRCALCHYAGAKVALRQAIRVSPARTERGQVPRLDSVPALAVAVHLTAPARAPPLFPS